MNFDKKSVYCFDSSAFIIMHRYYSYTMVPDLWLLLDQLIKQRRLFSHEVVFSEIVPEKGEKDLLAKWFISNKLIFIHQSQQQINLIGDIISHFPRLINHDYEKNQADPWLIASLIELMNAEGLFAENSSYVLVSMENVRSDQKLPAACKYFNIRHMTLEEFFTDNNFRFKVFNE